MNFFKMIKEGWLVGYWGYIFSVGGLIIAIVPWLINLHVGLSLFVSIIGCLISLTASYEAKAKLFGYQAPFTNDPLGWRKAKQSYKQEPNEPSEPAQPQGDQTPKRDEP
jgi:hypothetical protein